MIRVLTVVIEDYIKREFRLRSLIRLLLDKLGAREHEDERAAPVRHGFHQPPAQPHPSYSRLSRYDETGLIWLLCGREVVALTEATAVIRSSTGAITIYRRHYKPALGPVGDSLDDLEPPGGAIGARSALAAMTDNQTS
jgi:hypothetical protein